MQLPHPPSDLIPPHHPLQALQEIVSRGADPANIRVVAVVAAPPALKLMADAYPGELPVGFFDFDRGGCGRGSVKQTVGQ